MIYYFMCLSILSTCMYLHQMHGWCPTISEKVQQVPWDWIHSVVSCHLSTGNQA